MDRFTRTLSEGARCLGIDLDPTALERMAAFYRMVVETNDVLNLTRILEPETAAIKHFVDSLSVELLGADLKGGVLVDVGTGAGFPGLVLKLHCPSMRLCMLDSSSRRMRFVERAVDALCLKGVEIVCDRAETAGRLPLYREHFDIGVARAVAGLPTACEYVLPFVRPGGLFVAMKGPRVLEELPAGGRAAKVLGGRFVRTVDLTLPFVEEQRSLVVFEKLHNTDMRFPRRSGIPKKRPLPVAEQ